MKDIFTDNSVTTAVIAVGRADRSRMCCQDVEVTAGGSRFKLTYGGKETAIQLMLPGLFNVYNALAAAAMAVALQVPEEAIIKGLSS